jgi:hypothetical protein
MKPINIEKLMNHSIGVSNSYYRATENEILEDYLKAVDQLIINSDRLVLEKQVAELKEKTKDTEYIIRHRLEEKENEIDSIKRQMAQQAEQVNKILLALQSNPLLLQIKPEVLVAKAAAALDEDEEEEGISS